VLWDHACVLTGHRYLGLAGSVGLAVGAYRVGARPGLADRDGLPGLAQGPAIALCLAGLVALTVAWWGLGSRVDGGALRDGRWMLTTAALWALPLLVTAPLASRDVYAYACQGARFAATDCAWIDSVPAIWRAAPSPYGPLATLLAAGVARASGGNVIVAIALFRVITLLGIGLGIWYGRRLAIRFGVGTGPAAWLGLAAPVVLLHAAGGAHHDALMTGLVLAALWYGVRGRGAAGGLLLGLAAAVKVTALVALPFLVVALLASARRPQRSLPSGAAVVSGSALLGYAVLALPTGLDVDFLAGLGRTGELAQWTSVPTAVGMTAGYALRAVGLGGGFDDAVAVARGFGVAAILAIAVAAWWWAWRASHDRSRRAVLGAGVTFGAVAVLGPVFYPWYAITPLALLAVSIVDERPRRWLGVAAGMLAFLVLPNGTGLAPRTKAEGAIAVTAALVAAAAVVLRRGARATPTWTARLMRGRTRTQDPQRGR
jgi:alpha-1,6-mannosyltransferase